MILTAENYFSPEAEKLYMGSTQLKRFLECEAGALAYIEGKRIQEETTALMVGKYVDAYFEGTLALFKAQNPQIFSKRDGSLLATYSQAEDIIRRIERDEQFVKALSGQKQVIMTGTIADVPFKIKIDSMLPDMTVDLKIMKDFEDVYNREEHCYEPWWKAWGYDIQGAIYREIRRQNEGVLKPFGIAAATKEKDGADLDLIQFPPSVLDDALALVEEQAPYFDMLKKGMEEPERCGKCDWCKETKVLKGWRMAEFG